MDEDDNSKTKKTRNIAQEDSDVEVPKPSKKKPKSKSSKKGDVDSNEGEEDDVKAKVNSANKIEAELGELPADVSASLTGTIGGAALKSKKKSSLLGVDSSINALI